MRIQATCIQDVLVIAHCLFEDTRGLLIEAYSAREIIELDLPTEVVHDYHSGSVRGMLRGEH
jgi:dTDP-4-dehydrorhamnose 3,5-epimerase-like enzyme